MRAPRWSRNLLLSWYGRFGPVPRPERWVFIVGCYNSGTTLLHRILAMHPDVGTLPGEGQFFTDVLPAPRDLGLPRLWALQPQRFRLTEESRGIDVERLKRQWGARFNDLARPVLAEKSPTNAARTRWLQEHFEDTHFVGLVRNGYAVAEGIRRREGHDIRAAARQWRVCNEIMQEDFARLRRARIVRYESLAADPNTEVEALQQFAGLARDTRSFDAVRLRIHDQSSPIRNMNGPSIASLTPEDRDVVRAEAGEMLDLFGYDATAGDGK